VGVTCGCVREPGSRTLPCGVRYVCFSATPKNIRTSPEWVGTHLRARCRLHTQYAQHVTLSTGGICGCVREPASLTLLFVVEYVVFSTKSKKQHTPPESPGTWQRARSYPLNGYHLLWGVLLLRSSNHTPHSKPFPINPYKTTLANFVHIRRCIQCLRTVY
jgi:hypothetical protein